MAAQDRPLGTRRDINLASVEDLAQVKDLGQEKAAALVAYRDEHGDFESWDEVATVPGLSAAVVANLKEEGFTLEEEAETEEELEADEDEEPAA